MRHSKHTRPITTANVLPRNRVRFSWPRINQKYRNWIETRKDWEHPKKQSEERKWCISVRVGDYRLLLSIIRWSKVNVGIAHIATTANNVQLKLRTPNRPFPFTCHVRRIIYSFLHANQFHRMPTESSVFCNENKFKIRRLKPFHLSEVLFHDESAASGDFRSLFLSSFRWSISYAIKDSWRDDVLECRSLLRLSDNTESLEHHVVVE